MKRVLTFGLLAIIVALISYALGKGFLDRFVFADEAPKQPIEFSHKIHAGDNKIECRFCHIYAKRSRVSGVPSVQRCMGCHSSIRKESPEIKKLTEYWESKKPIPWIKVHDLPDYVYFPHDRHVNGGVDCKECHGDVAKMARVKKVSYLVMGWCLSCHSKRNGPTDDCWECHI